MSVQHEALRTLLTAVILAALTACNSVDPMPPHQLALLADAELCERQRHFSGLLRTPYRQRMAYSDETLEQGLREGRAEIDSRALDCTPHDVAAQSSSGNSGLKCKSRTDAFGTTRTECE